MRFSESGEIFDRHIAEHPLIEYHAHTGGSPVKISDFLSTSQFHRLGLYNEFFRRIGIEDQMAMLLPSTHEVIVGIALNRSNRSFSERDRLLLNLMRPHLLQAYRNAAAWTRAMTQMRIDREKEGRSKTGFVLLSSTGRLQSMTAIAKCLLTEFFPGRPLFDQELPEPLIRWIDQQHRILHAYTGTLIAPAPDPLVIEQDAKRLVATLFPDEGQSFVLLEHFPSSKEARTVASLDLSGRENEVLEWVAQGKKNTEIAAILEISPRTVQKHIEHIFQKLGVESRTAAAKKLLQEPR